jgi:hypothetical protein
MKDISLLSQKLVTNLKLKLQYPTFMAFIVGACIDQSLGITSGQLQIYPSGYSSS